MPRRIRSTLTGEVSIAPAAWTLINGVPQHPFNNFNNYYLPDHISYISDVVGKQGQNNPVGQVSIDFRLNGGYSPLVYPPTGNTYSFTPKGRLFVPSSGDTIPEIQWWPWTLPISAATLSEWSLGAFTKFSEQVPATISLANSLYELKDIKGLIPNMNLRSLKDSASGNFLGYEFGVLPMISDIQKIASLSSDVDKRLKHLIEVNKKSTGLSFNRTVEDKTPYGFFVSNDNPISNIMTNYAVDTDFSRQGLVFKRVSTEFTFHIGGKLYQDLQGLEDSNAKLKGLIASSGFNHPGRVIWNAIPYSFVVDWFFSLGKLIDTLAVQPFGGTYQVSDVMWSVKSESHYEVIVQWGPGWSVNRVHVGTARVKTYERYAGFPAYSVVLTNGTLTPMQQVLGLAMIHQRM